MPNWKDKRKSPIWGKCKVCEKDFDWRFNGLVNAKKEVFCSYECFSKNVARVERDGAGEVGFDDL